MAQQDKPPTLTDDGTSAPPPLTSEEQAQALEKLSILYNALSLLLTQTVDSLPPEDRLRGPLDLIRRHLETISRFRPQLLQDPDVLDPLVTLFKEMGALLKVTSHSLTGDDPQRQTIDFIRDNLETTFSLHQRILRMLPDIDPTNAKG